jgi:hypothetical protein
MAYSEDLAERVRDVLAPRVSIREQKMFGGVAWMLDGNMACGVIGEDLLVRLERDEVPSALALAHVGPMEFTGRPMSGFVLVDSEGVAADEELARWVDTGADYAASLPAK